MKKVFLVLFLAFTLLSFSIVATDARVVEESPGTLVSRYTEWTAVRYRTETTGDSGHTGVWLHGVELPPQLKSSIKAGVSELKYIDEWVPEGESRILSTYFFNTDGRLTDAPTGLLAVYRGPQQVRFNFMNGEYLYTRTCWDQRFFRFRFWQGVEGNYLQVKFSIPNEYYWNEGSERNGTYYPNQQECSQTTTTIADFGTLENGFNNNPNFYSTLGSSKLYRILFYSGGPGVVSICVSHHYWNKEAQRFEPFIFMQYGSEDPRNPCVVESASDLFTIQVKAGEAGEIATNLFKSFRNKYGLRFGYSIPLVGWTPPPN